MSVNVDIKRVSIISIDNMTFAKTGLERKWAEKEPEDKFFFVHILILLLGLMNYIPFSFFLTANGYWMYKFRNVSAEAMDTDARTTLQTHFSPGCTITNAIPMVICTLSSAFFGRKIKARKRVLIALTLMTFCFVIQTGFIEIDTDSWQTTFFGLTMGTLTVLNGANFAFEMGFVVILSKFPPYYMKIYLFGQGCAPICNALLQIASLAIETSTTASALLYFLLGTVIVTVTLALFYLSKFNKLFIYHAKSAVEDTTRNVMQFSEMYKSFKFIWPLVFVCILSLLTTLPTHTAITALIVSEDYGSGSQWTDKFFVPTITFLFSDITSLLGRIACSKTKKPIDGILMTSLTFVRMLIFVPLIYFCNAQPRKYWPLLLPHDWQYILVIGTFSFTRGYLSSMLFLDIKKLVPPEKVEDALMVLMSCIALSQAVLAPISYFAVDLL